MRRLGVLLVILAILIEYCVAHNSGECVHAEFKISNVRYTEALKNHSSVEYKDLVGSIRDYVLTNIPGFVDITVEFFRNSTDGSVIVHATIETNKKNQKRADNFVRRKLEKAGFTDVSVGVRLCVAGYQGSSACIDMKVDYPKLNIICVEAIDRHECIQWLNETKVDVVSGDVNDIYLANEMFPEDLRVVAQTKDKKKKHYPFKWFYVAVVRRSTITKGIQSLKGSKFCSTGYAEICGWWVPLSKLLAMGELKCSGNGSVLEQNLEAFSSYFGEACLPGQWGPIEGHSNHLKTEYSNLCSLCNNPNTCKAPIGRAGALKCLNSGGDVAWDTLEAVNKFKFPNPEHFGFLCLDGSIMDLNSSNPCFWSGEPWPGWLIRADENEADVIVSTLRKAAKKAKNPMKAWAKAVLGITKPSVIHELDPPLSPYTYLNQGGYYITINKPGCEGGTNPIGRKRREAESSGGYYVKFCVTSDIALQKCNALAEVLKSNRTRPLLKCIEKEDCPKAIVDGDADFVSLDGGDVFTNYRDHMLIPVISEVYGIHAASYFAVAVVKADSDITKLADLEDKDSCHTGINKTAGWNMPLKALLDEKLLKGGGCDYPKQIGDFFKDSCAPGANSTKYDPKSTNPSSLCDRCIGNGKNEFVCDRDVEELYYGYSGAFRCLVQGGDVAFVKHTTVPDNTDGLGGQPWNKNLKSINYRLLCKKGGPVRVEDYENCNLAKVPSHMVVTRDDDVLIKDIRDLLLLATELLPLGNDKLALFGDYGTYHDVLFKNSATSLINLSEDEFEELQKDTYWQALETLADCN